MRADYRRRTRPVVSHASRRVVGHVGGELPLHEPQRKVDAAGDVTTCHEVAVVNDPISDDDGPGGAEVVQCAVVSRDPPPLDQPAWASSIVPVETPAMLLVPRHDRPGRLEALTAAEGNFRKRTFSGQRGRTR